MTFSVVRLGNIDNQTPEEKLHLDALGDSGAHPGFLFVINDRTQAIVEPVWLYLYAMYRDAARIKDQRLAASTSANRGAAYHLAQWLAYLAGTGVAWNAATHQTVLGFVQILVSQRSAHTGRDRETSTIGRLLGTLAAFYGYTNTALGTKVEVLKSTVQAALGRPTSRKSGEDDRIHPLPLGDIERIRRHLGPLPSELPATTQRSCRDRLIFEVGLRAGLRGEEICFLLEPDIRRIKVDKEHPNAKRELKIWKTKRKSTRKVGIPNSLIGELQLYAKRERRRILQAAPSAAGHDYLFVNLPRTRNAGRQVRPNTIQRRFNGVMRALKLGTWRKVMKKDAEVEVFVADHSFHDTRHSFATLLFISLKVNAAADPLLPQYLEPWEVVQHAMGHDDWQTTKSHYLRHTGIYEAEIGVRVNQWLADW